LDIGLVADNALHEPDEARATREAGASRRSNNRAKSGSHEPFLALPWASAGYGTL